MYSNAIYGLIRCEGADAKRFLQGQLSCDVERVQGSQGGMGCIVNLKGRVFAAFYLYAHGDGYQLIVPADQCAAVLAELKKFAVFSKVTLSDCSDAVKVLPVLLEHAEPSFNRYTLNSEGDTLYFVIDGRARLYLGEQSAYQPTPRDQWFAYLIDQGIVTLHAAQRELFLPHYIGLIDLGAVAFDKGCYKGQEVIARMHYRGKLKKSLFHTQLMGEHALSVGDTIPEGEVVNVCYYQGNTHVLGIGTRSLPE